jgi:hypothetical protein
MSIFSTVILNFNKFRLVCSTHFCSVETCCVNSLLWYLGPIRFILLTFKFDLIARNSSDFYNFSLDTRLQWFWKLYGHSNNIKLQNSRLNFGNACVKSWQRRIIRVLKSIMENLIWVKIVPNKQTIGLFFSTRNGITKNKNPLDRYLKPCPRVWFSFLNSKTFGKSLKTFDSQIFFFLTCWYGFS